MGLADEAIGGVGALYARAMSPELFQGDSFSNTYTQARDLDRAENKQLEQNNPWTYGGANLVGGVAMPMGMAGQGLKGAVKAGGIAGGLTGYGMSENTNPYSLALDTATGAALGAGAGAALYGAGKVATNPQVQKFAKDYLADESGALKLLPDDETIKLYRGLTKEYDPSYNLASTDAPIGYSTWTNNPELAKQYAGEKGFVYQIDLPKNKKGVELIDKNGERYLYLNNQKKAGLNNISGDEYLVYNYHEDFSPNLIKRYGYNPTESGALNIGGRKDLPVNATQEEFDKILEGNVNRPYLKSWLGQRGISKKKGYSDEQISSIVEDAMDYRRNVILKDVIKKQREVAEKEAIERSERMAYYNSPEYQRKKIAYDLEETENIQSAKDRLKWSVPSVKEVESYHNFYGKNSFNDRFYSNEAAQKATLEAIQREAKKRGIEIVHASGKASAKNASSIYLRHPEFGEVRVSNHELPDTAERAYKREQFGTRWNGEYIIGNDWKKLNLDEIFDKIKKAGLGEE